MTVKPIINSLLAAICSIIIALIILVSLIGMGIIK